MGDAQGVMTMEGNSGVGTRWKIISLLFAVTVVTLPTTEPEARVRWTTPGSYRFRLLERTGYTTDADNIQMPHQFLGTHRLRLEPMVEVGPLMFHLGLDVLTGQVFGTTTRIGADLTLSQDSEPNDAYDGWTTIEPRTGWIEYSAPWADLKGGQYATHWGLGVWENDGVSFDKNSWNLRPGDSALGDLVDRLQLSVRPLAPFIHAEWDRFVIHGGVGTVFLDDRASLLREDEVFEWYGGMAYPGDDFQWGTRYLARSEDLADGDSLQRYSLDSYLSFKLPVYLLNSEIRGDLQALWVSGETAHPGGRLEQESLAVVGRATYRWHCPKISTGLRLGWVQGDDPRTTQDEGITLDPDYRVGFLLFSDVIRSITVRQAERLKTNVASGDRRHRLKDIPTHGGVRNVMYLEPAVTWRHGDWALGGLVLAAWMDEPGDLNGGFNHERTAPIGQAKQSKESYYGTEYVMMARYTIPATEKSPIGVGLDWGFLVPGKAIEDVLDVDAVMKMLWRVDVGW